MPVHAVTPVEGRLEYAEGIHVGHRAWLAAGRAPGYLFGHGLGYTTWAVDSIDAPVAVEPHAGVPVAATIRNTGARRGKAVVQFYVERVSASDVDRPVRWLAQFETADLTAGESRTVETTIPGRRFAHWADGWIVEPGTYRVIAAFDVADPGKCADLVIG